jgi:hypothetical protein
MLINMSTNMRLMLPLIFAGVLLGCAGKDEVITEKPLARVMDRYIYISDIAGIIPTGLPAEDSTAIVRDFVEKWVRNQLILSKAELNLTDEEKDVEQQIDNYRTSLLIYAYEQSYLRQNLDTVVTDEEVEKYYKENQSNFILNESLLKGIFMKIPVNAPDIFKVRQWYRSDNPEYIKNLEGYCFKHASVYDHFNDGWVKMNEILPMIPAFYGNSESALLSRRYIETRDSAYFYFLSAKEVIASGTVSPLVIVKNDIQNIILNKRKIKLINELEAGIYTDAQNREHFTIYP